MQADYDFDPPIESYAILKKSQAELVGIDWHRLATRKTAFFVVSGDQMLRLTNQIYQTVPLRKSSRLS